MTEAGIDGLDFRNSASIRLRTHTNEEGRHSVSISSKANKSSARNSA